MNQEERREFVRQHRTAVYGFGRQRHGPAMSIVYYVLEAKEDGNSDILVWTMAERGKAKAVSRNPHASLCVLDEKWPTTYVVVYGHVTVEDDPAAAVELGMRIMALMAGQEIDESKRTAVEKCRRRASRDTAAEAVHDVRDATPTHLPARRHRRPHPLDRPTLPW